MVEGAVDIKAEIIDWVKAIGLAIIIGLFIKTFIFNTTLVDGSSMNTTLNDGDRLFTNKILYFVSEPQKGDIVILKAPDDESKDYIKRVIATAGDTVKIEEGKVYLNGELLVEAYQPDEVYTYGEYFEGETITIAEDEIFVMGDNRLRGASKDSRIFGPIKKDSIKGKANFRYYPFNNMGGLK